MVLGGEAPAALRAALDKGFGGGDIEPRTIGAVVLGSPDFQRR